ncbi:MAG TPA: HAMP domain-containing sensor histidine kinase [Cyclobacteriaceae bacterium]|nr:HAMP domain-containing sensor histidine kinase [Cyclobacteriaceae bacterium]
MKVPLIVIFLFSSLLNASYAFGSDGRIDSLLNRLIPDSKGPQSTVSIYLKRLSKQPEDVIEKEAIKLISALDAVPATRSLVFALREIGVFYEERNLPNESLSFFQYALKKVRLIRNSQILEGDILRQISTAYREDELYNESLNFIYQSLKIYEAQNDHPKSIGALYDAMTINYKAFSYEDAIIDFYAMLEIYNKLPKGSESSEIKFQIMSGWNTVGLACRTLKRNNEGLEAFVKASELALKNKNQFWYGLINGNKGELLLQLGNRSEAKKLLLEDMRISLHFSQYQSAAVTACTLSTLYFEINDLKKSKDYLDTATTFFSKGNISVRAQQKYLLATAKLASAVGDYKKAYQCEDRLRILRDSTFTEEKQQRLAQFKARYELEKKQDRIQLLSHLNDLQNEKIKDQERLLLTALAISVLAIGFLVYAILNYRKVRIKNNTIELQRKEIERNNVALEIKVKQRTEELQETNNELDKFLYHASHDIRRPIATILGLEQVARLTDIDSEKSYLFEQVGGTARDMDRMLFKLQMAHQLNKPITDFSNINLHQVINRISRRFDDDFNRLNIDYLQIQESVITCYTSPALLTIILTNLIENAINFRKNYGHEKPYIKVTLDSVDGYIKLIIEDNGIGIMEQYLDKIFDLYFRGNEQSKGNGLGLYLVKKTVSLLNGTIDVKSEIELGTTFTIQLPNE